MTSDTILASALREGDVIKRQGRPDAIVIGLIDTGANMLVTAQSVLHYRLNDPVNVDRIEFHNTKGASV